MWQLLPQLLLLTVGVLRTGLCLWLLVMGCGRKGLHQTVAFLVSPLYFQRHLVHLEERSGPRHLADILEALMLGIWEKLI